MLAAVVFPLRAQACRVLPHLLYLVTKWYPEGVSVRPLNARTISQAHFKKMHFWIDKRTQYAYTGRHRMPTTISSGGVGRGRARVYGEVGRKPRVARRSPAANARRARSNTRQNNQPVGVHGRRTEANIYMEVPMEPALPSLATIAAARCVTPDTLLRTAALGLPAPVMAPHLKFGMMVSFALATLFLIGAKYYFDRQMVRETNQTSHEAGIIVAAALCVSGALCALLRCRTKSQPLDTPDRVTSTARYHPPIRTQITQSEPNSDEVSITTSQSNRTEDSPEAPPPYHIAVLLPPRDVSPPHYSDIS